MDASRLPQLSITKRLIAGSVAATLLAVIACEATEERTPSDIGAITDTDAPVQAYIAAMPGWKRDIGKDATQRGVESRGATVASGEGPAASPAR